jgi:ferredoxin-NADP reductase
MNTWYEGIIARIETPAAHIRRIWLEVPSVEVFDFKAGQFITMDLPIGEKRLQRWRSYSIANEPDGTNLLEFCIVRSASGDGTKYLFETAEVGTAIRFKGPDGTFCLPEKIEKDLVFICTGTGVAPFRSMIRDLLRSGQAHRKIHLIFGARTEDGILYRDEFESVKARMPNFSYDIALSRQADWPGYKGHVHGIYMEKYREKRPDIAFFLCGWSAMIDEAVAHLIVDLGYDRTQVLYELYG